MNATNKIIISLGIFSIVSCSVDPKKMANEYCDCFHEANGETEALNKCGEMMNSHREALAKDKQGTQEYSEQLMRCVVYDQKK